MENKVTNERGNQMTKQEYINARLENAKKRLVNVTAYLNSDDARKHRNISASQRRVLARLLEVIPQLEKNELTPEYEYFYQNLYADRDIPLNQVSVF